jgi:hypothetical protein
MISEGAKTGKISPELWFGDILDDIQNENLSAKNEAVKVLLENGKRSHALCLLKSSLKIDSNITAYDNIISLLNYISDNGYLSEQIRHVHNHVCHFSSIELDGGIKADLYDVNQLYELIIRIESNLHFNK